MGGGVKKFFKKEFRLQMFSLEPDDVSDFYLSSWQRSRSTVPLLLVRTLIFIGCLSTLVAAMVIMTQQQMSIGHWFIFMTDWGVLFNTVTSGLACVVSLIAFFDGPIETNQAVVKIYWVFYNATITVAFYITIFYWSLLTQLAAEIDYALDPVLDVFIHGINSVFMFVLLMTSRHRSRMLHFYFPLLLGIIYMIFSIIYYYAGGLSPFGTVWIYPMLDWSQPGQTVLVVIGSAFLLIVIHWIVVALSLCRDALSKRCRDTTVLSISDERYY